MSLVRRGILFVLLLGLGWVQSHAQTCTISGSGTINWTVATCVETGSAPVSGNTIVVPVAVNLRINNPAPSPIHTGNLIIFGTLTNDKANARWDGNITIKSTGQMVLNQKFDIGPNTAGCGYTLSIETGGQLVLNGSGGSDLLSICGQKIAQSGGSCNSCGGTNSGNCPYNGQPYCEPTGGFTGPLGYDEGGALPVDLIFFQGKQKDNTIQLQWATSAEEDFDRFVVQHSINAFDYVDLAEIPGAGYNTESRIDYRYTHDVPVVGNNYYRLMAIDLNGSYEYFGPIATRFKGTRSFWVHPNPSTGDKVSFETNFSPEEGDRIQVFNQMGLLITEMPVTRNSGALQFTEALKAGSYILRYSTTTETLFARFVVVR